MMTTMMAARYLPARSSVRRSPRHPLPHHPAITAAEAAVLPAAARAGRGSQQRSGCPLMGRVWIARA